MFCFSPLFFFRSSPFLPFSWMFAVLVILSCQGLFSWRTRSYLLFSPLSRIFFVSQSQFVFRLGWLFCGVFFVCSLWVPDSNSDSEIFFLLVLCSPISPPSPPSITRVQHFPPLIRQVLLNQHHHFFLRALIPLALFPFFFFFSPLPPLVPFPPAIWARPFPVFARQLPSVFVGPVPQKVKFFLPSFSSLIFFFPASMAPPSPLLVPAFFLM